MLKSNLLKPASFKPLSLAIASILLASAVSPVAFAQDVAPADEAAAPDTRTEAQKAADRRKAEQASQIEGVIVTGTRSPKSVEQIPGAISVVTPEEVAHTLAVTEDATAVLARTVPGYAESSQAMSNTGENLRGRVALRLFDGVPQGSPLREGTRNGTFTDMGVVGRIEVINGPSASEGIGGAGGVINYISKAPTEQGHETTLVARYSSQFNDDSAGWKLGLTHAYMDGDFDFIGSVARIERGISYDGDGRRVGMNTSGSVSDSTADNLFLKAGYNFGEDGVQRIQASYADFKIAGHGDYIQVEGCRYDPVFCPNPTTNTSERGSIAGSLAEFNDFRQFTIKYTHADVLGGNLTLDYYWADQAMRYLPENGDDKQIERVPAIGETTCTNPPLPCGPRIWEQSEIDSEKSGIRGNWAKADIFGVEGLELRVGLDIVRDEAQQRLALTDTVWVPPMDYKSFAPWMQASWDIGPVTISGGFRRQDDELSVEDYTTTYFRKNVFVEGGNVEYKENLKNLGAIWRIGGGFSVFAAYGEGFTLPNIGIPLRNINTPGQSVERIDGLEPIIFSNREFGFNWRGSRGSLAGSHYDSRSALGGSLSIDPATNDFILTRAPVEIKGYEFSGEWRFNDAWKATALYSHMDGKTSFWGTDPAGRWEAGGLNRPMGVLDLNPDKFGWSVNWKFMPNADVTLGATKLFSRDLSGSDVRDNGNGTTSSFSYSESTTGHTLFDLSANYQTANLGKFTLGVENLFDKFYVLSWSQVPGFQNYWAGRGRFTSLTWSYTF
jgi:iron complex outermembrane receptor protein